MTRTTRAAALALALAAAMLTAAGTPTATQPASRPAFDVYEDASLGRALAIEVVVQPRERAMTEAEIEALSERVVATVAKATGAHLRG